MFWRIKRPGYQTFWVSNVLGIKRRRYYNRKHQTSGYQTSELTYVRDIKRRRNQALGNQTSGVSNDRGIIRWRYHTSGVSIIGVIKPRNFKRSLGYQSSKDQFLHAQCSVPDLQNRTMISYLIRFWLDKVNN